MIKKIIHIYLFLASISISSQESKGKDIIVKYDVQYNTDLPSIRAGLLVIKDNKKESIFVVKAKKIETESEIHKNEISLMLSSNKLDSYVYTNFESDSLFFTYNILSRYYLVKEHIPKIKWNLLNEESKIGNLHIQKARAKFRGRNYTAWFTKDIPIRFGPWKFNDLPGLITEIYDDTNTYRWTLKTIYDLNDILFDVEKENYEEISKDYEKIGIKEYVYIKYTKAYDLTVSRLERLKSILPRGAKLISSKKTDRGGIETIFEWEIKKDI